MAETWWDEDGSFTTQLPEKDGGDRYRIFYSGGKNRQKGVGLIVSDDMVKAVLMCESISDRIIIMRLKAAPVNILIVQIYAPCEYEDEEEKESFYERVDQVIPEFRKRVCNCDG